jgi:hypothetical protein
VEVDVVPLVLDVDERPDEAVADELLPLLQPLEQAVVRLGRAEAVDAGDRGDDQDVVPGQQRVGGRVAHPVDLVVDRAVLLDERVGRRDVGLGLVVVVVADEVVDGRRREELLELPVELRRQRLVVGDDQGRPLQLGDDVGDREGLPRAGDAQEDLIVVPPLEPGDQLADGPRLVAGRLVVGLQVEGHRTCLTPGAARAHAPAATAAPSPTAS